jgi:hypothetical protein
MFSKHKGTASEHLTFLWAKFAAKYDMWRIFQKVGTAFLFQTFFSERQIFFETNSLNLISSSERIRIGNAGMFKNGSLTNTYNENKVRIERNHRVSSTEDFVDRA